MGAYMGTYSYDSNRHVFFCISQLNVLSFMISFSILFSYLLCFFCLIQESVKPLLFNKIGCPIEECLIFNLLLFPSKSKVPINCISVFIQISVLLLFICFLCISFYDHSLCFPSILIVGLLRHVFPLVWTCWALNGTGSSFHCIHALWVVPLSPSLKQLYVSILLKASCKLFISILLQFVKF